MIRHMIPLIAWAITAAMSCDAELTEPQALPEPDPVTVTTTEPGSPPPQVMAIDTLSFTREGPTGIAPGFDLDGQNSPEGDEASCGKGDFTSPEGVEGIDNQLAMLTPLFDLVGLGAVEDLVQRAIEDGGLLIMFELDGVDDLENDPEVTFSLNIGSGTPLLGTDGLLLSGQTFNESDEQPPAFFPNARIENGVLHAGPGDTRLPIVVFGVSYELNVKGGFIRAELTYDGGLVDGVMGGAIPMDDLWAIAVIADQEAGGVMEAVTLILEGIPDMQKDAEGECQAMSAALEFTAVSAFFAEETP